MRITLLFVANLLLITLVSCKDKNKSIYEGCCGAEITTDSFFISMPFHDDHGNWFDSTIKANVYIPNLITNDNSGENARFTVFTGSYEITKVLSMDCSDKSGNLLFHKENFLPNTPEYGWNGIKTDGTAYQGSFNYEVMVQFVDGQIKTYIGKSCAYSCGEEGFPIDKLPNCFVLTQHDGNGGHEPSLPFPFDCFQ